MTLVRIVIDWPKMLQIYSNDLGLCLKTKQFLQETNEKKSKRTTSQTTKQNKTKQKNKDYGSKLKQNNFYRTQKKEMNKFNFEIKAYRRD